MGTCTALLRPRDECCAENPKLKCLISEDVSSQDTSGFNLESE